MNVINKVFLVVGDTVYNYTQLIDDLNKQSETTPIIRYDGGDPYEVFKNIVHSLIYGYPIVVIDGGEEANIALSGTRIKQSVTVTTTQELTQLISNGTAEWGITLQTSGTTGDPKPVSHNFGNFTRNVKQSKGHANDVWGFAYNPSHMAGLQVFFQALLNLNTIIYVFDDYKQKLPYYLNKYSITHISATPTYYRSIMPYIKDIHNSVLRITSGGEKFDVNMIDAVKKHFPNAKISNIYASTEAGSIFASKGDVFSIPGGVKQYIKIINNELLIHESLIGGSEQLQFEDGWYHTGDIVEVIQEDQFRFISRNSDAFNVGGYNVNPLKVENVLQEIAGVSDVLVKPLKNKITGNIVVADVVKEDNFDTATLKVEIKKSAAKQLKEWEIPRIINVVESIEQTRTGKKVRK